MSDMKSTAGTWIAAVVAAVASIWLDPATAASAATLDLSGFDGEVRLLEGSKLEARPNAGGWRLAQRDGSMVLQREARAAMQAPPPGGDCDGGFAPPALLAPSTSSAPPGSSRGARVEITIPPATRVQARGFAGTLQSSAALIGPLLEVRGGKIELARVQSGDLSIVGPGSITVGEAGGRLSVAVTGPGVLHLRGGRIEQLTAALDGKGSIRHDGVAARAILAADGEGAIRVRRVEEPVRIEQGGFASIATNCDTSPCDRRR